MVRLNGKIPFRPWSSSSVGDLDFFHSVLCVSEIFVANFDGEFGKYPPRIQLNQSCDMPLLRYAKLSASSFFGSGGSDNNKESKNPESARFSGKSALSPRGNMQKKGGGHVQELWFSGWQSAVQRVKRMVVWLFCFSRLVFLRWGCCSAESYIEPVLTAPLSRILNNRPHIRAYVFDRSSTDNLPTTLPYFSGCLPKAIQVSTQLQEGLYLRKERYDVVDSNLGLMAKMAL